MQVVYVISGPARHWWGSEVGRMGRACYQPVCTTRRELSPAEQSSDWHFGVIHGIDRSLAEHCSKQQVNPAAEYKAGTRGKLGPQAGRHRGWPLEKLLVWKSEKLEGVEVW